MSFPNSNCFYLPIILLSLTINLSHARNAVVFQTDFSEKDGGVAAMRGVAFSVSSEIAIHDLTHLIPEYNIWEAAYRLNQTSPYWPPGTVFVNVVDPGDSTTCKSVVLKTKSGHYFVSADNGSLTLVAESLGIDGVREIDEKINLIPGAIDSNTFPGRDLYAYTGARLAAAVITFEEVGPLLPPDVVRIEYPKAKTKGNKVMGGIPILDTQFGNVWTNIHQSMFLEAGAEVGDLVEVKIFKDGKRVYNGEILYGEAFGSVEVGQPILYMNSLKNVSVALNMANFAEAHGIGSGPDWSIEITLP